MSPRGVYERSPEALASMTERLRRWTKENGTVLAERGRRAAQERDQRGAANPDWKGDEVGYGGAHARAKQELANDPCSLADDTCQGQLEAAFKYDAPKEHVRLDQTKNKAPYYVGPDIREGYWRLCHSHHTRYDDTSDLGRRRRGKR